MKVYKKVIETYYTKDKIGILSEKERSRTVITKHYLFSVKIWETSTRYIIATSLNRVNVHVIQ